MNKKQSFSDEPSSISCIVQRLEVIDLRQVGVLLQVNEDEADGRRQRRSRAGDAPDDDQNVARQRRLFLAAVESESGLDEVDERLVVDAKMLPTLGLNCRQAEAAFGGSGGGFFGLVGARLKSEIYRLAFLHDRVFVG